MSVSLRLDNRSRVKGDFYARICERLRGKFPGSTRFVIHTRSIEQSNFILDKLKARLTQRAELSSIKSNTFSVDLPPLSAYHAVLKK